ncbi:MAG: TetR/AcrR family transcriptional regulator [Proteobacteria bacterium]|nr:TetR/AcrR family transcriptional regulator [Pseudomonadota bacterium]
MTDTRLVEERRGQVLRAAVKLFSERGYYTTTIQQIAKEAGVSIGLIYQYFGDKDDVLFLSLKLVLESYEKEIPLRLEGIEHPVERLCMAVWAYCMIVDRLRDATVLAYRSTKSLRADRRALIKDDEIRTNRMLEGCLRACIAGGYMREVNEHMLVYQYVMFCHAWALKNWAFEKKMSVSKYVDEGIKLLVEPFLTAKGKTALASVRLGTGDFKHEKRPARRVSKARAKV